MIKNCVLGLLAFSFVLSCNASNFYVYPDLYKHDSKNCELKEPVVSKLSEEGLSLNKAIDIDQDGICELFFNPPSEYIGTGGPWLYIYDVSQDGYKEIGITQSRHASFWLGEERNGFARLLFYSFIGHRTDPTYTVDVYYFNGDKYVIEHASKSSYGHYADSGLKSYKSGDYKNSEKWYLNAYRMKEEKYLKDANNLALVLIKMGRCEEAIDILNKHLKTPLPEDRKYIKAAKFNLSLCAEGN